MTNVIKHARATDATVTMTRGDGQVTIVVRDNGQGFVPGGTERSGFGLIGIAERARLFGGEPHIQSTPGQGTTIQMTLEVNGHHGARDTHPDRG